MTTHTAQIAAVRIAARTKAPGADSCSSRGVTILMGIITAEALYPGSFSTCATEISDLGGTRQPNREVRRESDRVTMNGG